MVDVVTTGSSAGVGASFAASTAPQQSSQGCVPVINALNARLKQKDKTILQLVTKIASMGQEIAVLKNKLKSCK